MPVSSGLKAALKGTKQVAPNATHYLLAAEGHWVRGKYADSEWREGEYGEQLYVTLTDAYGEGFIRFGAEGAEKTTPVELAADDHATISITCTRIAERLFENADLVPGQEVVFSVGSKREYMKGNKKRTAWNVELHMVDPGGSTARARRIDGGDDGDNGDNVPFSVPGEKGRGRRRGPQRGRGRDSRD